MTGQGEVERLEPWQLPAYLQRLQSGGTQEVTWNRDKLAIDEAIRRATGLTPTAAVVTDGETIYVAEPDHSADEEPRRTGPVPLQIWPRKRAQQ